MGGLGKEKEIIMYNYEYVTRNEALPIKKELIKIINQVQDLVREHFTFNFYFISTPFLKCFTTPLGFCSL